MHKQLALEAFSMGTLVGMANALGGGVTMKTFSQRSKAIERIIKLAEQGGIDIEEHFDIDGRPFTKLELAERAERARVAAEAKAEAEQKARAEEEAAAAKASNVIAEAKAAGKPKKDKKSKEPKPPKGPSIRSIAEALLLEVTGLDENKRKVGHSYETILAKIGEQFPNAKTTIACLRWYAVHMRDRGVMPPTRPRAVPAKNAAEAAEAAK